MEDTSMSRAAINARFVRAEGPTAPAPTLVIPAGLSALVVRAHGVGFAEIFELPPDYRDFLLSHGGGLCTLDPAGLPDPYGWTVSRFPDTLAAATTLYGGLFAPDTSDWHRSAKRRWLTAVRKVGLWLEVGSSGGRHLHFVCCDRTRPEFGRVVDVNDGDPTTGLVPDRTWADFRAYIA